MSTKTTSIDCPVCGFPVGLSNITINCPFCGKKSTLEVAMRGKGVSLELAGTRIQAGEINWMPTLIAFGIGVIFGPALLTTTRTGAETLAKIAEEKLKKK